MVIELTIYSMNIYVRLIEEKERESAQGEKINKIKVRYRQVLNVEENSKCSINRGMVKSRGDH